MFVEVSDDIWLNTDFIAAIYPETDENRRKRGYTHVVEMLGDEEGYHYKVEKEYTKAFFQKLGIKR